MSGGPLGYNEVALVKLEADPFPNGASSRGVSVFHSDNGDIWKWVGDEKMNGGWYRTHAAGSAVVYVDNPHEKVVNEHFHLHTGVSTTLAVAISTGDTSITVADPTGFIVGNEIQIEDGVIEVTFPEITAIVGSVFTLDRPLDNAFSIGDIVGVVETDVAATAGTLGAPISYRVTPTATEEWGIARVLVQMILTSAGDDSLFGNLAALTNGVDLRIFRKGAFTTFTNWKNNGDIIHDGYDATYNSKAGGGNQGFVARWTFERIGAVPKLEGSEGDYFELLVQDDITALVSMQVKAQGFVDD